MAALEVIEVRTLDGPNIFLLRPAIKVQVRALADLAEDGVAAARARLAGWLPGGTTVSDGPAPALAGLLLHAVTGLHAALGLPAPATRVATGAIAVPGDTTVAHEWAWRSCAEGIARTAVALVEAALADAPAELESRLPELAAALEQDRAEGDRPLSVRDADRRIPIVGITGTNGKTTTTRCLTHILAEAGRLVGMANSSGVWIGDEQVLAGDYTGPAGARRVLEDGRVEVAVLETARGGILLRGVAYESNDVGVVTNVSADHLGLQGIDTVDGLAEVKSLIVRLTRPEGSAVLNADNALTCAMAARVRAPVTYFSREPDGDTVREQLGRGGRAVVADGGEIVLREGEARTPLVALADVPMTFGGRAPHMVENALAAAAAALGLGLEPRLVARGLASFRNSPEQNYGRLNVFALREPRCTAIVDYAHNEAGIGQLLAFGEHFRGPRGRLLAIIGTAGDRPEEILRGIGRVAGERADAVWIKETDRYLRGASKEAMNAAFVAGVEAGQSGPGGYTIAPGELAAVEGALAAAGDGDVIAVMCLEQQAEVLELLTARGTPIPG
jgi:cyanophycin synthetase